MISDTSQKTRLQTWLDIAVILCLGLYPAVHLPALQIVAVLILIGAGLNYKAFTTLKTSLNWHHIAILQFLVLSLINVLYFPSLEGNREHYKPLAIEALATTLAFVFLVILYLQDRPTVQNTLRRWLPVGLLLSFVIVTSFYVHGEQGSRVQAFSTNALIPPMWFLVLTLITFNDFESLSRAQKSLRIALMGMAALMAIYSGGRLAMITWVFSACALIVFYHRALGPAGGKRSLALALGGLVGVIVLIFGVDHFSDGTMLFRITYTVESLMSGKAQTSFLRLELWSAAWSLIGERPIFGHGQINERFLLHQILERDWWFRAHQTYLSYWIGGGLIGLASGVLFQLSALTLILRKAGSDMRPAALALVAALGLNGLTESIFQSYTSIQLFSLLVLLLSVPMTKTTSQPEG